LTKICFFTNSLSQIRNTLFFKNQALRNRDVHGNAAAADFLKNHRGSGRLFKIHRGSGAVAVDFLKIHRGSGSIFFRGY